ncbi:MAG: hypothetical protein MRZ42_05640 [Tenericutes bacterium]|nr:hypothetical protein [Mycoplasmatota bacterium]
MDLLQIILYLGFAIILFFILNYFQKFEDKTPSIMIIIPVIYIILISGISFVDTSCIYLVILMEMFIRIYYTKIILNQEELMNTNYYIQNYGLAIILAFIVTRCFIIKVDSIFPTASEWRMGIWLLIILFLYKTLNGVVTFKLEKQEQLNFKMKEEMIIVRYAKLKNSYSHLIKSKNKDFNSLIYAIMIFKDYHRSNFLRSVDKIRFRFTGKTMKMGIMQVETNKEISDEESIKIVIKDLNKIEKELSTNKKIKKQDLYQELLREYGFNNIDDVFNIYKTIKDFDNK